LHGIYSTGRAGQWCTTHLVITLLTSLPVAILALTLFGFISVVVVGVLMMGGVVQVKGPTFERHG
jgi:hypothetical protein